MFIALTSAVVGDTRDLISMQRRIIRRAWW